MPRPSNQEIEAYYFEKFRGAYADFPEGEITHADKPDVTVISTGRTIGIEITNLYIEDGTSQTSEQQQRAMRRNIVAKAHNIYRQAKGTDDVELTISFHSDRPVSAASMRTLPKRIAAWTLESGAAAGTHYYPSALEEIAMVYVAHHEQPTWRDMQVHGGHLLDKDRLVKTIRAKEASAMKLDYRKCDVYWLLVVIDFIDRAQDQEISMDTLLPASPIFERVILFKTGFNEIVLATMPGGN